MKDTLARGLWKEGLATYVAWTLHPDTPLDSKSPEDYRTFFLGNPQREDILERSGYCVGYLVARELGRTRASTCA